MANARVYELSVRASASSAGSGARVFDPLKRVRHRPPAARAAGRRVEHRRRERLVRLQARERVDTQPEGVGRGIQLGRLSSGASAAAAADMRGDELADEGRRCGVADQPERFGRAPRDERRRIGHRRAKRLDRRRIADEAEREGRHLPDLGIGVGSAAAAPAPARRRAGRRVRRR